MGLVRGRSLPGDQSPDFARAAAALRDARLRPEVRLTEVPAPQRIAPYAVALTAEVVGAAGDEDELASGRFVLLHDPAAPAPWEGEWRVVTFVRAELEPELAGDPMLGQVGWSWLVDALDQRGVDYANEAGTVTRVVSESFAGLADREPSVEMEVRASWTPQVGTGLPGGPGGGASRPDELGAHLLAWSDLLCTVAGLPPLPEGVVALPGPHR